MADDDFDITDGGDDSGGEDLASEWENMLSEGEDGDDGADGEVTFAE